MCRSIRPYTFRRAPLPRHDVRLPDERARLRAHPRPAGGARARGGVDAGRGRRARLQHLHDPREARPAARRATSATRGAKARNPDTVVAVGGCYAEAQRDRIFERYPFVDVAFGPGTIHHLGDWLGAGGAGRCSIGVRHRRTSAASPLTLATQRERPFQAWVQVSMGCNSVCSYCIVPAVRGREVSRRPGEILAEVDRLADDGVREITLLGQNVNSWGRDLLPDIRTEFGELLRAVDADRRHRAHSLHEPAPEGLPRTCHRRDGRVRRRLRARAPAAPVRLDAGPQARCVARTPRTLPPPRRRAAGRNPRPRAHDGSHRRLPRRDRR